MSNAIQAKGSSVVTLKLTRDELQLVRFTLLSRQKEAQKITPDYPKAIYAQFSELDVRIERLKMKLAKQVS